MSESQHLAVIRVWAAAAWADGTIAKPEAAAMRKLIDASKELSAADRETALDFLEHKVELEPNAVAGMSEEARQGIYRAAVRLSRIDREVVTSSAKDAGGGDLAFGGAIDWAGLRNKYFLALLLDTRSQLIRVSEISVGSLDSSIVHPREVFKEAISASAASVIFIHNHPSARKPTL